MKIRHVCILCTCPNVPTAQELSQYLLENQLAACVNILSGITSMFVWDQAINSEHEVLMLIKTHQVKIKDIESVIKANHPYDTPELIALPIVWGSEEYLDWIDETITATGEA